jgi:hypothetical protein
MLSMKSKNLLICGLTVGTLSSCYQEIPNPAHFGKTIEVNASIQDGRRVRPIIMGCRRCDWHLHEKIDKFA